MSVWKWFEPCFNLKVFVATRATIYRSLQALRAQNRKKVSKRVCLGVCKTVSVPENARKSPKIHKIGLFRVFWLFRVFSGTSLQTPKKTLFEFFFCDFGPGGPGDSKAFVLGIPEGCSANLLCTPPEMSPGTSSGTAHLTGKPRPHSRMPPLGCCPQRTQSY